MKNGWIILYIIVILYNRVIAIKSEAFESNLSTDNIADQILSDNFGIWSKYGQDGSYNKGKNAQLNDNI